MSTDYSQPDHLAHPPTCATDSTVSTPLPSVADALQFADEIRGASDCWIDRCLIVLHAEVIALRAENAALREEIAFLKDPPTN